MEKLRNRLVNGRAGRRRNNKTEGALVVLRFIFGEERGDMVKRGFPRGRRDGARSRAAIFVNSILNRIPYVDGTMQGRRKIFRIEAINGTAAPTGAADKWHAGHHEIMAELKALRAIVEPQEAVQQMLEAYKGQIAEAHKLKAELEIISTAIARTKTEIATLHVTGFEGPEMARVSHELDAVVDGTEQATQQILGAAEFIDQSANTLAASVRGEQDRMLAADIQEHVIRIFEACNFQDLTGQRISKVVATLKFIETHIARMIEIWGGLDAFAQVTPEAMATRAGARSLLNGPRLAGEPGHAGQDEIDALFA
jgi:chemotaxis protein CheZ